jgi:hypothetical protein
MILKSFPLFIIKFSQRGEEGVDSALILLFSFSFSFFFSSSVYRMEVGSNEE